MLRFSTCLLTLLLTASGDLSKTVPASPSVPPPAASAFSEPPEPPVSEVCVGDMAPDFSYQGFGGEWMRLHHALDQGSVLLVFSPSERQLTQLESEHESLLEMGVITFAVVNRKPSTAQAMSSRLALRYTVLADPRQVIASQFNVPESTQGMSWFVIDRRGRVRGLARGKSWNGEAARVCARALGLPLPGTLAPVSR